MRFVPPGPPLTAYRRSSPQRGAFSILLLYTNVSHFSFLTLSGNEKNENRKWMHGRVFVKVSRYYDDTLKLDEHLPPVG